MGTKPEAEAMTLYANLMHEVKVRAQWIEYAVNGRTGMDAALVREFCFLQLRLMCECTALACLVAHGDIDATKTKKFRGSSAADDILKGLENLNRDAFPAPLGLPTYKEGIRHFPDRALDYMTKSELLKLYGRTCGAALHKGSLKNLLKTTVTVTRNYPEITTPTQRMINLLTIHRIGLFDGAVQLICFLNGANENVSISVAEAQERP